MKLNFHNWELLKEYFPNIEFSKKDLQTILSKEISKYDLNKVQDINNIDTLNIVFLQSDEIKQLNKDFRGKSFFFFPIRSRYFLLIKKFLS